MVSVVFSPISGQASAKPTGKSDGLQPLDVTVEWEDKGFDIAVGGPEEAVVSIVIWDKNGDRTVWETKYDNGAHRVWIHSKYCKNPNDIYIVYIDAKKELKLDEKGRVHALDIQVVELELHGNKGNVKVELTKVMDTKLFLELVSPAKDPGQAGPIDELDTGKKTGVILQGIDRHSVRLGAGPQSLIKSINTIRLLILDPDFNIDSFFDVFVELDIPDTPPENAPDSFFDVFYSLESRVFDIDSFFDVFCQRSNKGLDFHIDSFFDVFFERKDTGSPDSFFDVFVETDFELPYPGRLGGDFLTDSFFDVFTELKLDGMVRTPEGIANAEGTTSSSLTGGTGREYQKFTPLGTGSQRIKVTGPQLGPFSIYSTGEGAVLERESFFDVFTQFDLGLGPHEKGGDDNYADSFFDVFTEMSFNPTAAGATQDSFFDVFSSLAVNGHDWDLVAIDDNQFDISAEDGWEAPNAIVDSFFDVFTSFHGDRFAETLPDDLYHIDSFFDVFVELDMTDASGNDRAVHLDWTSIAEFDQWDWSNNPSRFTNSEELDFATSSGDNIEELTVDSFFDVFVELDVGETATGLRDTDVISVELTDDIWIDLDRVDSFFDVFVERESLFPSGPAKVVYFDYSKETEALFPSGPAKGATLESFFDVFVDPAVEVIGVEPSPFRIDSFFDVFTESRVDSFAETLPDEDRISYSLYSTQKGARTLKPEFAVDSFFDVFTELTMESDNSPDVSLPAESFFDVFTKLRTGSIFDVFAETLPDDLYHIDSFFDVFAKTGIKRPPVRDGESIPDSFFDVFTELSVDSFFDVFVETGSDRDLYHIDSFFDVFVELELPDEFYFVNDVIDIGLEEEYAGLAGRLPGAVPSELLSADSFFDVFVDSDTVVDKDIKGTYIGAHEVGHSLLSFLDEYVEEGFENMNLGVFDPCGWHLKGKMDIDQKLGADTGGGQWLDSFFDVFVVTTSPDPTLPEGIKYSSAGKASTEITRIEQPVYHIDSFFDIHTDLTVNDPKPGVNDDSITKVKNKLKINLSAFKLFTSDGIPVRAKIGAIFTENVEVEERKRPKYRLNQITGPDLNNGGETGASPDSFFDVFTELSVESFFDVLCGDERSISESSFEFGADRTISAASYDFSTDISGASTAGFEFGADRTLSAASYDFSTEIVSDYVGIQTELDDSGNVMGVEPSPFHVDSFFDVFTELSIDNNDYEMTAAVKSGTGITAEDDWEAPVAVVDSFFDVFTELDLGEAGQYNINLGGGGHYHIDSFFDVFTELSIDLGSEATGPISPPPEKTAISLSTSLTFNGRGIDLNEEGEVMGVDPEPFHFDSYYNVHIDTQSDEYGGLVADIRDYSSFFNFDDFAGNSGSGVSNSILLESSDRIIISFLRGDSSSDPDLGGGEFNVDSFFDVYVEVDTEDEYDPVFIPGYISTTRVNVSEVPATGGTADIDFGTNCNFTTNIRIQGIADVTNPDPTTPGEEPDTDESLRARARGRFNQRAVFNDEEDSEIFKNEISSDFSVFGSGKDPAKFIVAGFDALHKLTRGRDTKHWIKQGNLSFVSRTRLGDPEQERPRGSESENALGSYVRVLRVTDDSGNFVVDSFFDVYVEIETDEDGQKEDDETILIRYNTNFSIRESDSDSESYGCLIINDEGVIGDSKVQDHETVIKISKIDISKLKLEVFIKVKPYLNPSGGCLDLTVIDESDPDGLERVKVKFPWLHEDDSDETHWARVVTVMAGSGLGSWVLPEIDDEVLVAFEYGDISMPIIVGGLWDGTNLPSVNGEYGSDGPGGSTQKKTKVTPDYDDSGDGLEGFDIRYKSLLDPEDHPDLDNLSTMLSITNFKPGEKPQYKLKSVLNTNEQTQFTVKEETGFEVVSENSESRSILKIKLSVYEKYTDPTTGKEMKKLAFVHTIIANLTSELDEAGNVGDIKSLVVSSTTDW
jgi:hypothetical protein